MHVLVMNKVDKTGNSGNDKINGDLFVEVPRGWSRGLENDSVVYISPTSDCLRSKADVVRYLVSDQTCKCGLECPLNIDSMFNFDANIPSRHFRVGQVKKANHKCELSLRAANNSKPKPVKLTQTDEKKNIADLFNKSPVQKPQNEDLFSKPDVKRQLPSFATFAQLPEEKLSETLQGQIKPKKTSQPKRPGCYKRKSSAGVALQSVILNSAEQSNSVQQCRTVHATNTPITHSFVKTGARTSHPEDVVTSPNYPRVPVAVGAVPGSVTGPEEQCRPGMATSLLSFSSSHLNASSYLASLSSGGSPLLPTHPPFSHAEVVCPPVPTGTASHPLASKTSMDYSAFSNKPVTCMVAGSSPTTNKYVYLPGGPYTNTSQKSTPSWKEIVSYPVASTLASSRGNIGNLTLGKSKGGFSMKTAGNSSTSNRYLSQYKVSTSLSSLPVSSSTTPSDLSLYPRSVLSGHGQPTSRTNSITTSEKVEPCSPATTHPLTPLASQTDKSKPRAPTSKIGESANQPLQYCGILLQPGGMIPQVATASARSSNLGTVNIQGIDPAQFASLYALQGIPYANNVNTLGNSGVFGMSPAVLPYVFGIAQTGASPKTTAASTSTAKVSTQSASSTVSGNVTTTGAAAIAAAYSAFVSIAPASGTSSSYSQQLMNLVNTYNNPYWQQLLTHGVTTNALAYQLMQLNQFAALRGSTGQATASTKSSTVKHSTPSQPNSKQTLTTSTAASSGSSQVSSQGVASAPVAVVVVSRKELSSVTSTSPKTNNSVQIMTTSSSVQPTCPVNTQSVNKATEAPNMNNTNISEPSLSSCISITGCKVSAVSATSCITSISSTLPQSDDQSKLTCGVKKSVIVDTKKDENDSERQNSKQDAKSCPKMSHEVIQMEIQSENLESSSMLQCSRKDSVGNSININMSESLGNANEAKPSQNVVVSRMEDPNENSENAEVGSLTVQTDGHCDESVASMIASVEKCQTSGDTMNSVITSERTNNVTSVLPNEEPAEKNEVNFESNINSVQSDGSEENDEDDILSVEAKVVRNGEIESTSNDVEWNNVEKKEPEVYNSAEFTIGDVVWAQARGLPSWPGKIVDERDLGSAKADNGKKWVMWFGDHTHSQVEVEKLKTLSEGLKTLDDKGKKRKYRGKKTRIGLEQAIGEALEELDRRDRLRSRQGPKAKKRKLRV